MGAVINSANSFAAQVQAREALRAADPRDFEQRWNKGREEFHLKLNGYTEYIISRNTAAQADSQYTARVKRFGREESLSMRYGDLLTRQLRETFTAISLLQATQKENVINSIRSGAILEHIVQREAYSLNAMRKGVIFSSQMADAGQGAILIQGDLVRDMNHPDKRLVLEVTWRSSVGTGGPLGFVVDRQYAQLLDSTR